MKRLPILPLLILLLSIAACYTPPSTTTNVKRLTALGQLWGFLKYHHPAVAAGKYDWDMELIERIPKVMNAQNDEEWKSLLDAWIDTLPPVTPASGKALPNREVKSTPDYGKLFNTEYFFPQTIEKIKYILDNAVITSNHYISIKDGIIDFSNEVAYEMPLLPDTAHRLLALFRHWNIINYFFPYRNMCDQKWSEVLPEMIPEFIDIETTLAYYKTCQKLQAKINDSHGFYVNHHDTFLQSIGTSHPPFKVRFIGDKLVITKLLMPDECIRNNIKTGDIITAINNEPIDDILKREIPYHAASNHSVMLRDIANYILCTNADNMKLSISNALVIDAFSHCYPIKQLQDNLRANKKEIGGYQIIENNIGYVYPASCTAEMRNKGIKKVLTGTSGLIIDLRCYPSDYLSFPFLEHLDHHPYPHSLVTFMDVSYPGYAFIINKRKTTSMDIIKGKNAYNKKIVVIVNEETQSQAEDIALGFQLASHVTVIGSTTAGANGATTKFSLPGGIINYMSGRGVYYPDGSNLQRSGVKIDEVVLPTIQGIRDNRDEVLERAIEIVLSE